MTHENWKSDWGLTSWRPTRELEELGRSFEDLFGRSLLPCPLAGGENPWSKPDGCQP